MLRDAATGAPIRSLARASDPLGRPAFSPDGALVAAVQTTAGSAAPDGITVWEVASGRRLARLPVGRESGRLPLSGSCRGEHSWAPSSASMRCRPSSPRPGTWRAIRAAPASWHGSTGCRPRGMDWNGGDLLTTGIPGDGLPPGPHHGDDGPSLRHRWFHAGHHRGRVHGGRGDGRRRVGTPWRLTVWDGKTGRHLADPRGPSGHRAIDDQPGGALLAAVDIRQDVYLIDRRSGAARRIVSEKVRSSAPPDGRLLTRRHPARDSPLSSYRAEGDPSAVSLWDPAAGRVLVGIPRPGRETGEPVVHARRAIAADLEPVERPALAAPGRGLRSDRQPAGHKDEAWAVALRPRWPGRRDRQRRLRARLRP